MRELTDIELELIAGGWDDTETPIVVPGVRPPNYWFPPFPGYPGHTPPSYPGSPGGGTPPYDPNPTAPTDDCAAKTIAEKIAMQEDSKVFEYKGLIYKDTQGNIHSTPIKTSHQANTVTGFSNSDFGIPAGAVLMGMVHNHPTHTLQAPGSTASEPIPAWSHHQQSMPSWDDMDRMRTTAHTLRDQNVSGWQNFTQYILFNGVVKEFKYSDQDWANFPTTPSGQNTNAVESAYRPCT